MNKKSIYLLVITTITVICIFFGARYHIGGFVNNVKFHWPWLSTEYVQDDSSDYIPADKQSSTIKIEDFNNIDVNLNVGSVEVKSGSEFSIYYNCTHESLRPVFNVKNNCLNITQKYRNKPGVVNRKCDIVIQVPYNTELSEIDIKAAVGEIHLSKINLNTMDLKTDVGEIHIDDSTFAKADLKTDVGEIHINGLQKSEDYSFDLKTDIGEVTVLGRSGRKYSSTGKDSSKYINAKTNIGEININ